MTIKSKFFLCVTVLVAGVLLLGTLSVWNLVSMYRSAVGAAAEYTAMDRADATANQILWLRDVYRGPNAAVYRDTRFFTAIQNELTQLVGELRLVAGLDGGDGEEELRHANTAATNVASALARVAAGPGGGAAALTAAATELDVARTALLDLSKKVPDSARRRITGAADRLQSRLAWTCGWLLVVLVVSAGVHAVQYRSLVRPLVWLRDDMRVSKAAGYLERVRARGDKEYVEVAGLFNGLARDLSELYRNLEEKVISRSRELVRSERLASVGFLAAGVAHEINNPLGVISGYAELAAKGLKRVMLNDSPDDGPNAEAEAEALAGALDAQQIIRDEAFRCKEITGRLLSLARGGTGTREPLRLDELATQVTVLTRGLRDYRDRRVIVEFGNDGPLPVLANAVEMKQVLMNLTVNALEAAPGEAGEVRVGGRRAGEWVEIYVADNGKGMSAETLNQVFEPFYTAKRGAGEPGTGLGLSITHAIVENHGGRIHAESPGPGRGSRFVVRLPAATGPVASTNGKLLATH